MLVDFQQALADLVADPALCRQVRADPGLLHGRYRLSDAERSRLVGMVRHDGMSAACSVYRMNRLSPLAMNLRRTLHALGPRLAPTLDGYWREHPRGHPHFHLESERFCRFLLQRIADGLPVTDELCEAFADEADRLALALRAGEDDGGDEAAPGTGLTAPPRAAGGGAARPVQRDVPESAAGPQGPPWRP